jgi:serine phosphatase RsbU (regulator of sigma subunit)
MSATPHPVQPSTHPAQKLILIVDDTPTNIGVISGALKDFFRTKIATNGEKGLALANAEEKPDLILLDIMMPGIDGYEVCARLKASPATAEIPVIFLTGQTGADDETRGFECGAVDYIHKPFSPAVVKARVRSHIMLREARAQLAAQLAAINQELEMARQIQLAILPHSIPQLPGLEIAARYSPMTSVAGDFYDFIQIDDNHIGILIADVSGHGLPSALIASMIQVALGGQTPNAAEPAKVLAGLNRALRGKFTMNFVTAAYVYLDLEKGFMRYAGAGHPPVLRWRNSDGKTTKLIENGIVLGMIDEVEYSAVEIPLESGDRHVLYTDGIPEAANASQVEYGFDRFMDYIGAHHTVPVNQFADNFCAELAAYSNQSTSGQQDDITLLLFDYRR